MSSKKTQLNRSPSRQKLLSRQFKYKVPEQVTTSRFGCLLTLMVTFGTVSMTTLISDKLHL